MGVPSSAAFQLHGFHWPDREIVHTANCSGHKQQRKRKRKGKQPYQHHAAVPCSVVVIKKTIISREFSRQRATCSSNHLCLSAFSVPGCINFYQEELTSRHPAGASNSDCILLICKTFSWLIDREKYTPVLFHLEALLVQTTFNSVGNRFKT